MKFENFRDLAGREIWPANGQLHVRQLRANEGDHGRSILCQFFRSCIQVALLFEVFFAMLGHFFVVRRVAWGVLFLSSTTMEASSTDAKLFFVGGQIDIYSSLNCRSNKGLVNIAISKKKKRAKMRSWCVPGPLKVARLGWRCGVTVAMVIKWRPYFQKRVQSVNGWPLLALTLWKRWKVFCAYSLLHLYRQKNLQNCWTDLESAPF